jgi:hypothetical protein
MTLITSRLLSIPIVVFTCASCGPRLCVRAGWLRELGIPVGAEHQLTAGHRDILGDCDLPPTSVVRWTSTDASVATITAEGVLQARSAGMTNVLVRSGRANVRILVRVVPTVARIALSPDDTVLAVGDTAVFRAVPYGTDGEPLDSVPVFVWPTPDGSRQRFLNSLSAYEPSNKLVAQARGEGNTYVKGYVIGRSDSVPVRITRRP